MLILLARKAEGATGLDAASSILFAIGVADGRAGEYSGWTSSADLGCDVYRVHWVTLSLAATLVPLAIAVAAPSHFCHLTDFAPSGFRSCFRHIQPDHIHNIQQGAYGECCCEYAPADLVYRFFSFPASLDVLAALPLLCFP